MVKCHATAPRRRQVPAEAGRKARAALATRIAVAALLLGSAAGVTAAEAAAAAYPNMAPLTQYLSATREEEIALARSAAPPAISKDAEVLAFGAKGYEAAVKGTNGFVCIVIRSWDNNFDKADFWNPRVRAPQCFNKPAARSVLPTYLTRTEWVLAGVSREGMLERTKSALAAGKIQPPEVGSMVYMMSKQGYLGDDAGGPWYPHLMFILPRTSGEEWGADLKGSPIFSESTRPEPLTVFFVPVGRWSDGTPRGDTPLRVDGTTGATAH